MNYYYNRRWLNNKINNILLTILFPIIMVAFLKLYFKDVLNSIHYKSYSEGTYEIGVDLPNGEYLIIPEDTLSHVIYSKDQYGIDIIYENSAVNSFYIAVEEGNYLIVKDSAKMYSSFDAPTLIPKSPTFHSGMYKVGRDLEPGDYILSFPKVNSYDKTIAEASVSISTFPNNINDPLSCEFFSSTNTNSISHTLANGQYINLKNAYVKNTDPNANKKSPTIYFEKTDFKTFFFILFFFLNPFTIISIIKTYNKYFKY